MLALPIGFNVMAQEIKKLTLEDLIPGGETYRYAENLYGLQWWGDVCIKPSTDTIYTVQPRTGKETVLTTLGQINKVLADNKAGKLPTPYSIRYPWADKPQMLLKVSGKYIVYDFENNRIVSTLKLKDKAANEDYCVANGNVAYTVNNNLYVNEQAITDEPEGIVCGQSVHRNEFGINKGTFWSPKGNLLAFYRMDESMVTQYPLVDITARVGEVNNVRYPMAGMTSHQVKVGVYNPSTGKTIYLNAGDPTDRYFTNISWSPDEKSIYLIELNRDQNHAVLCQYDATTGKLLSKLLEETHPKYVEPQHPIVFLPWDSSKFIYQSQRDGYNHLYLCDLTSSLKGEWKSDAAGGKHIEYIPTKQLTEGKWLVGDILGFNAKRKEVIFQGVDGTGSNNFAVNVNTGKCSLPFSFRSITEGEHNGMLSASGSYLIDRYSTPTLPRRIDIVDTKSLKTVNLLTAKDPYEGYEMPTIETGTIKADDGTTDLYYRLTKPADFDPNKKYPVIVYVYGGPHAQLVTGGWLNGSRGWDIYMANKGYIMFTLDNRGSANRGLEFENATFRRLGIEEGKDQVKGIEFLKSLPYIDGNRIGVHGWSFGGHMTTALLLRYPEIFKVGVAGGPVIDWGYYEVMYGERYMDSPHTNPEGYAKDSWGKVSFWADAVRRTVYLLGWNNDFLLYGFDGKYKDRIRLQDTVNCILSQNYYLMDADRIWGHNKMQLSPETPSVFYMDRNTMSLTGIATWNSALLPMDEVLSVSNLLGGNVAYGGDLAMAEFVGDRKYYTAINSPSLWKSKDAIRVKQAFNDTIYTISEQGLTPYLVFELGEWHWNEQQQLDVEGCDKKIAIDYILENAEYIYFHFHTSLYLEESQSYCGFYHKEKKTVVCQKGDSLFDKMNNQHIQIRGVTSDGHFFALLQPDELSDDNQRRMGIEEEGNPIMVMLY